MQHSTSWSHEWDDGREEFRRLAQEQVREQSLELRRALGPTRKAIQEYGINGDPLADVPKQPQTLRHQLAKVGIARYIPPHIYARYRDICDWMIDIAVQTHQGPI